MSSALFLSAVSPPLHFQIFFTKLKSKRKNSELRSMSDLFSFARATNDGEAMEIADMQWLDLSKVNK